MFVLECAYAAFASKKCSEIKMHRGGLNRAIKYKQPGLVDATRFKYLLLLEDICDAD